MNCQSRSLAVNEKIYKNLNDWKLLLEKERMEECVLIQLEQMKLSEQEKSKMNDDLTAEKIISYLEKQQLELDEKIIQKECAEVNQLQTSFDTLTTDIKKRRNKRVVSITKKKIVKKQIDEKGKKKNSK